MKKLINITLLENKKVLINKTGKIITPISLENSIILSKEKKWKETK